jgi:cytochrome c nitrite reductase small subunit
LGLTLTPPQREVTMPGPGAPFRHPLVLAAAVLTGLAAGAGAFTFSYGRGASYLTNDPAACANCHVMQAQYSAWLAGSHRQAATCNDCHTPAGPVAKYATKAANGFWHSAAFTSGVFHEPIRIKPGNRAVAEARCRDCHAAVTAAMAHPDDGSVSCLACHPSVGHRR